MEVMNKMPKGWEIVAFDDVCEIISGKRQKDVEDKKGKYLIYGSGGKMGKAREYLCNAGTTIIGRKGTINKPIFVNEKFWNVDTAFGLSPFYIYDKKLFHYFCLGFNFKNLDKSTTIPSLAKTDLLQIKIPIPPLPEQHRIVAKIEELFSRLDKGIESLKTAQAQLKTYRQSVLKWAFEGKFTNENVKDGELPEGWKWKTIDEVANVGTGATPLKSNKEFYDNGNIAWVTSGALNDEYVRQASAFVTEKAVQETNLSVYPAHTLLLAMYGEGKTRGKCSELLIEACTNQAIAAIYFENYDIRIKPFLKYFLHKNYYEVRKLASGGVQPNLNLGIVKRTLFPLPPTLAEQDRIVAEIESRLSVCDKLEEAITENLQQAEALRQSILKKAFDGKLVPQDPTDEPARVLLERIRAEQSNEEPVKKQRKKKVKK